MTRSLALLVFLIPGVAFGQGTTTAAAPAKTAPVPTLKASAQLVVVDVVVTDRNRKPVHGLKASDFALREGGVPQTIRNFEEHMALTAADATKFAAMPKMEPGIFTNYSPEPANGAVDLLLMDSLNTPMMDQAYLRQQLLAYLKARPPGTRIAIFGLTTKLIVLQGFTSDPDTLKNVMIKGQAKGSPLLNDPIGSAGIPEGLADYMEDTGDDPAVVAGMRQFEAEQSSLQLRLRAKYTLDAMNQIARYLAIIPGRKNLIWFSGSFPLDVLPDSSISNPFAVMESSEDEFRETVDLLARSQVAVYPIDVRGLINSPVYDSSTTRNYGGTTGRARLLHDDAKFYDDQAAEHSTMQAMANATGGRAFVNTNGLTDAVATAIDEGSNFYTLTYTPTNSNRNGEFRKIKVQLAREGLSLAYRQGYFADDPDKVKKPAKEAGKPTDAAVTDAAGPSSADSLRIAMNRGAPVPTEILIKVSMVPLNPLNKPEDTVAAGNEPSPKMHGPYRHYGVNYAINPGDLSYSRTADGKIHVDYDAMIFVFDPDGVAVNSVASRVHITATLEDIRKMIQNGIFHHEEISAPIKGEYFFRIAVHDLHHDSYGAVEVASSSVKNVVPPTVAPATPAVTTPR